MQIIIFTHPSFLASQSMPRFATFLANGMKNLGHEVELWAPQPKIYNLPVPGAFKKWMGYVDQYLLFPAWVRKRSQQLDKDALFVFADQALGPWVPLVANRPHVIHCHDFLAQRSALDEIPENPTSSTGKKYQSYIRKGYQQGKNFISVSKKTQQDLHVFLTTKPLISEVVYNGLNQDFKVQDAHDARSYIHGETGIDTANGYVLHVGGNQWYKNRVGAIEIYNAWRKNHDGQLPLIMIGAVPNGKLNAVFEASPYKKDIHFLNGKTDEFVRAAYSGASVFLFPSLAEGFGWPIAEAMAAGTLVITTGEAPMSEVGGDAATYIAKRPHEQEQLELWAQQSAKVLDDQLHITGQARQQLIEAGIDNAKRFNPATTLKQIGEIYRKVLAQSN